MLATTNEYELLRFTSKNGIGIVYESKRGYTLTGSAIVAHDFFSRGKTWIAGRAYQRWERPEVVERLLDRDGAECFYCGQALEKDITVEHILSRVHGGSDNEANLCLVHFKCNRDADCLSVVEKIKMFFKQSKTEACNAENNDKKH